MKSILQEAEEIVNGERQKNYGSPQSSFDLASKISSLICGYEISAKDIIRIQIALKLTREFFNPKRDNRVDVCGYMELLDRLEE